MIGANDRTRYAHVFTKLDTPTKTNCTCVLYAQFDSRHDRFYKVQMKRQGRDTEAESSSTKKRKVEYVTFQKWRRDLDRDHQTLLWLNCSSEKNGGKVFVTHLSCKTCTEFVEKIRSRKNFSDRWIVAAESVRISNVGDHTKAEQHIHAMCLLKKHESSDLSLSDYAFNKLPDEERQGMCRRRR